MKKLPKALSVATCGLLRLLPTKVVVAAAAATHLPESGCLLEKRAGARAPPPRHGQTIAPSSGRQLNIHSTLSSIDIHSLALRSQES